MEVPRAARNLCRGLLHSGKGYHMDRRSFLRVSAVAAGVRAKMLAETPMPMHALGATGMKVSRFTLGGFHMRRNGEEDAIRIIHRALDLGVNFFDSARRYHKGESDATYGKAIGPDRRKKIFLMSKAEKRDAKSAMQQLEDTLRDMKTDYLDLWQCHMVVSQDEVDQILAPGGALEAFVKAKEQGKARHIGLTGHREPAILSQLLDAFDGWETLQHPVNLVDAHHRSFTKDLLPKARAKGIGLIAMKSNAMGGIAKFSIASIEECLRFSLSQDIDTQVSGVETIEQLEQNVLTVKTAKPMSKAEQKEVLARTAKGKTGPEVEYYKAEPKQGALRPHIDGEDV